MTAPLCVAGFLRSSANIDELNAGQALIHVEVRKGHTECVAALIQAGADVNQRDLEGNGPLIAASFVGCADCVKLLIDAGAWVNERNGDRDTAVHAAAMAGHADCIRLLARARAGLDWYNCDVRTALQIASRLGHVDCVVALLDGGAKTPLLCAVSAPYSQNVRLVRALLRANDDPNHAAIDGTTPMHAAADVAWNCDSLSPVYFGVAVLRLLRKVRADDDM